MLLHFVRHARPVVQPERDGFHWHLSAEGRAGADGLAGLSIWEGVAALYASPEPKAFATAQRIAAENELRVVVARDLREVEDRAWVDQGYEEIARRYLADEDAGWEAKDAVAGRVRNAVDTAIAAAGERDVAVVSHGLAITVFLAERLGLAADAAYELWSNIAMPDVATLDVASNELVREFGSPSTRTALPERGGS